MTRYIRRLYQQLVADHFKKNRQMLFLMGPRQVGKTTLSLHLEDSLGTDSYYLNWDNLDNREIILKGPKAIAQYLSLERSRRHPPLLIFDELHKFSDWKNLLKGFFDTYAHGGEVRIIVTGSARLDIFKFGGDSLMGRYFRYRIHPFTVGEIIRGDRTESEIQYPNPIDDGAFEKLYTFGGFPEPYLKDDFTFYEKWKQLRLQQLFYEDVRDITRIHQIQQMELLALFLKQQVTSLVNFTAIANKIRISSETVRRWVSTLTQLYYCFTIQPWSRNVTRSLLKEPKIYLWDWSLVEDSGAKTENYIASHLFKACHFWTDCGLGEYELFFVRDKEKQEVDFLVVKNDQPWFLVEVKNSEMTLSRSLKIFQEQTQAKHAFQVVLDAPYEDINCFDYTVPVVVSAKTFLSQLV